VKQYVIDTNALISFVTNRNPEQQRKIAPLFEAAARLKLIILCHQHVLTEFVYVMDRVYHVPLGEISRMVGDLIDMPGVEVIAEIDFKMLRTCWPVPVSDFGDAVIASVGMQRKKSAIVTFDQKFARALQLLGIRMYSFE
jgi:predicted nucleic acid-binding protein